MKLFILLIIISLFLQSSFVPVNLVLILIISRALVTEDISNYYASFFAGIFLGILSVSNIGYWPITLLIIVKAVYLSKKLPLSKNILSAVITAFILILLSDFLQSKFLSQNFQILKTISEALLTVPFYYLFKFWEDRFIVKPEVRLKIRSR